MCIHEDGRRVEEAEQELTRRLNQFMPVIGVITKARADQDFRSKVQRLLPEAKNVVRVRAIEDCLDGGPCLPPMGLEDLVEVTAEVLPEGEVLRTFAVVQKGIKLKKKQAKAAVLTAVGLAGGAGMVPIPLASEGLLIPIQAGMLAYISRVFGVKVKSVEFWRNLLVVLLTSLTGAAIKRGLLGTTLKFIPGLGALAGGAILGPASAFLTHKLGDWYIDFLVKQIEDSGSVPSLDIIKQGFKEFSDEIQKDSFTVVKAKT